MRTWTTAIAIIGTSLLLGACGGSQESTPDTTAADQVPPQTQTPDVPEPEPAPTHPSVGTVLATAPDAGRTSVFGSDQGFTIIKSLTNIESDQDLSTIKMFDIAGDPQSTLASPQFTGECGVADLDVAGRRMVLTELVRNREAQGVKPEMGALELTAWDPESGDEIWKTLVAPWEEGTQGCIGGTGNDDDGLLNSFEATVDGRWGIYSEFQPNSAVGYKPSLVGLKSGDIRKTEATGIIGNYLLQEDLNQSDLMRVMDPLTDKDLQEIEGFSYVARPPLFGSDADVCYDAGEQAGVSNNGELLIGGKESDSFPIPLTAQELGKVQEVWKLAGKSEYGVLADSGGITLAGRCVRSDSKLIGVDDESGKELWSLPRGEVCGVSESQFLYEINDQMATIDLKTGKQKSYADTYGCPDVLAGGIGVYRDGGQISVEQVLRP